MNYQPDWLRSEVLDGLCKLVSLGLDRMPAIDIINITADTWVESLSCCREWSEAEDRVRVRVAFATLAVTRTVWPCPRHFLEALPVQVAARTAATEPRKPHVSGWSRLRRGRRIIAAPMRCRRR